jgi:hypothetical protein
MHYGHHEKGDLPFRKPSLYPAELRERTGARSADGLRLLSRTGLRSPPPAAGLKCVSAIRKRSRLIPSGRALSLNGLTGGVAAPAARKK